MELNLDRFNLDGWKRHYQGKKGGIKSFDVQPSKMNLVLVKLVHNLWIMSTPNTSTALSSIIYPSGLLTQKFWGRLSELYQRVTVKSRGRVFKAERELTVWRGNHNIQMVPLWPICVNAFTKNVKITFSWFLCGPIMYREGNNRKKFRNISITKLLISQSTTFIIIYLFVQSIKIITLEMENRSNWFNSLQSKIVIIIVVIIPHTYGISMKLNYYHIRKIVHTDEATDEDTKVLMISKLGKFRENI